MMIKDTPEYEPLGQISCPIIINDTIGKRYVAFRPTCAQKVTLPFTRNFGFWSLGIRVLRHGRS